MKPRKSDLNNGISLRVYGQENDQDIVNQASAINEYNVYEYGQNSENSFSLLWIPEEDIELLAIWISLKAGFNLNDTIQFSVSNDAGSTIWIFDTMLGNLNILGSSANFTFPTASLIRKVWRFAFYMPSQINGVSIVAKKCHINSSIAAVNQPYSLPQ